MTKEKNIITNFIDGLLFLNEKKELVLVNKKAESLLNVPKKNILGKSLKELKKVEPLKKILNDFSKKEIPINGKTIEISFKNKKGLLVVLRDVTKEKMAKQMRNEFVSIVAHQLRTPISSIKWTLKMFLEESFGKINKEQEKYLEKVYSVNEKMVELINDLLNISRIEEGRYVYKPVSTDLTDLIEESLKQFKDKAENKKVNISFEKEGSFFKSVIDPEKIKLVLQNLIDNAIKYNEKKGKVTIFLTSEKGRLKVAVKDTGLGIPEKEQKKIFTKFFRAKNVMKSDAEGSGLGLYINKEIIEAHKGKIWFESKEGEGSTFYFSLPLAKK